MERIFYINLDHREDRKVETVRQLQSAGCPIEIIERFPAIHDSFGHIGCSKSHLQVLKIAIERNYSSYMVVEDDINFYFEDSYQRICDTIKKVEKGEKGEKGEKWDVIVLTASCENLRFRPNGEIHFLKEAQTTTGYVVNRHYYPTLLTNFSDGLNNLLRGKEEHDYAIDQYWKRLQQVDRWILMNPIVAYQRANFSDISTRYVEYPFPIPDPTPTTVHIIMPIIRPSSYLRDTLRSLQSQSYLNWRVWMGVANIGDTALVEIRKLAKSDPRTIVKSYLHLNTREKIFRELLSEIRKVHGKYIAICEPTDTWAPTKLVAQLNALQKGHGDIIGSLVESISTDGTPRKYLTVLTGKYTGMDLLRRNSLLSSAAFLRADEFTSYLERSEPPTDYEYWLQLGFQNRSFYNIPEVLTLTRTEISTDDVSPPSRWVNRYTSFKYSPITVVTAYFTIPSKYSAETYKNWIRNFMKLECCVVIFTDKNSAELLRSLRTGPKTHIIIEDETQWVNYRWIDYYYKSHQIDAEKHLHSPQLSMLWNEKTYFLQRAIKLNPYFSKWFIWTDIGSIRDPNNFYPTYPNIEKLTSLSEEKILLFQIHPFQEKDREKNSAGIYQIFANRDEKNSCLPIARIQGGCFGGTKVALEKWTAKFTETLQLFMKNSTYIGKDQYLMATMALNYPELVHLQEVPISCEGDPWFWFYRYLS